MVGSQEVVHDGNASLSVLQGFRVVAVVVVVDVRRVRQVLVSDSCFHVIVSEDDVYDVDRFVVYLGIPQVCCSRGITRVSFQPGNYSCFF